MKKFICLLLVLMFALSVCACGQSASAEDTAAQETTAEATTEDTAAENAPAEESDAEPAAEAASAEASADTAAAGSGEASAETAQNSSAAADDTFVYEPYWDETNVKTAEGGEILFFGDIHDYEDNFFYYDAETGETTGVFTYLVENNLHPGLYACIGDFLQSSHDITDPTGVYAKVASRIYAYAGDDIPFISVMGNHEYDTAAADGLTGEQVFERYVGNNNYGLAAEGVDENDNIIYYVVNFGCAHTQEIDAENTRANATNKYWVNPDEIAALDETLAGIYGENGELNVGVPTFINAHLPVHYYTDERCAENNCDLLTVLNKYPYVVYVWGHDHSEKDPFYGTIKLPGDTISPNASLDDLNSDGDTAAQEINFTYVACGVVRGNQISDNADENFESALYIRVDGSNVSFEYCDRNGQVFDRTQYTDIVDETYFEDFTTLDAASAAGKTIDLTAVTDMTQVQRGDFFLARPVAGETPSEVREFSDRYETAIEWLDEDGNIVTDAFDYGTAYTARLTLTGDVDFVLTGDDVFVFDLSAVTIPSRYIDSKTVTVEDGQAIIDITFSPTATMSDAPIDAVSEIAEGTQYVICSDTEQYLFTINRADCVAENGQLLTVPDTDATWSVESVDGGYLLRSSNGMYLTAGVNGPHTVLTPVRDIADGTYTVWTFTDGALHITVDGSDYCLTCTDGTFALTTGTNGACSLYPVS